MELGRAAEHSVKTRHDDFRQAADGRECGSVWRVGETRLHRTKSLANRQWGGGRRDVAQQLPTLNVHTVWRMCGWAAHRLAAGRSVKRRQWFECVEASGATASSRPSLKGVGGLTVWWRQAPRGEAAHSAKTSSAGLGCGNGQCGGEQLPTAVNVFNMVTGGAAVSSRPQRLKSSPG